MNDNIKIFLKERSKLTKPSYRNGQKERDHNRLLEQSMEYTRDNLEAKGRYILKMPNKIRDINTAPKPCSNILSLLVNRKIPAISALLVDAKFVSGFHKTANPLNYFFSLEYVHL